MSNIIAVVWDFDKTLVDGYMQRPIFEEYGVDEEVFWDEVNKLPEEVYRKQGVRMNPDIAYLNCFLREVGAEGRFPGLNNAKLRSFGAKQHFYPGAEELFARLTLLHNEYPEWEEYSIRVENYIVSTGFAEVIRGSVLAPYTKAIWGCELIETETEPPVLAEVGYSIDHTTKTRALFEINKGILSREPGKMNVNTKIPEEKRRVQRKNMLYIADGPSDVPAFSVVNSGGGHTLAVYPRGDRAAFGQVSRLREDERIDAFAEADYRSDSTAAMWIVNTIENMAIEIMAAEKRQFQDSLGASPRHLHK